MIYQATITIVWDVEAESLEDARKKARKDRDSWVKNGSDEVMADSYLEVIKP